MVLAQICNYSRDTFNKYFNIYIYLLNSQEKNSKPVNRQ